MNLAATVKPFIDQIASGSIELYNEFSLQHELGIYLRGHFQTDKVRFERNVSSFFPATSTFVKREIDIVIISNDGKRLKWAIELKFPRNGQHPEQIYSFCRDVVFAEELRRAGFENAAVLIFADDPLFWRGPSEGIYGYFRGGRTLTGTVRKPTGARDSEVTVAGSYSVEWSTVSDKLKFTTIQVA